MPGRHLRQRHALDVLGLRQPALLPDNRPLHQGPGGRPAAEALQADGQPDSEQAQWSDGRGVMTRLLARTICRTVGSSASGRETATGGSRVRPRRRATGRAAGSSSATGAPLRATTRPPGRTNGRAPGQQLFQRRDGAGRHEIIGSGVARQPARLLGAGMEGRHGVQAQFVGDGPAEGQLFGRRVEQRHGQVGPGDLQGQTRQTRPGADVQHRRAPGMSVAFRTARESRKCLTAMSRGAVSRVRFIRVAFHSTSSSA